MSESYIQLPDDGTGKLTRTSLQNIAGNNVHTQVIVLGDPDSANIAPVGISGLQVDVTRIQNSVNINGSVTAAIGLAETQNINGSICAIQTNSYNINGSITSNSASTITAYQGGTWVITNQPSVQTIGVVSASQSGVWDVNILNTNPIYGNITAYQNASYNVNGSNLSLCFEGKLTNESLKEDKTEFGRFLDNKNDTKCVFEFPVLNEILKYDDGLKQEEVQADIEIILESRYVKAWSSKIKIDKPIVVMMNENNIKIKDNISISIEPKVITEKKIIPKKQKGLYEGKKISVVTKDNVKRNAVITKIIDENKKLVEVKFNNDKKKTIKLK